MRHYRALVAWVPLPACFNNLGLALARDARWAEAVTAYEEAIRREPSAAAYINLGNAHRSAGDKDAARRAYEQALLIEPESAPALYNQHAAVYADTDPEAAMQCLERAHALRPSHLDTRFYWAALRALHRGDAALIATLPAECAFLVTSLRYVQQHRTATTRLFADTFDTLDWAWGCATTPGLVVELGVRRGTTLRKLAELAAPAVVHGFDAFQGLPEVWGEQASGLYSTGGELPSVPDNAELHAGWFSDTLPAFVARHDGPVRFLHVDCDLYTSTQEAFAALRPRLVSGTVIVFDEYLCNPGWEHEEHRAFAELGAPYAYLAFSLFTKQAAVILR